jgi:lysophospholipase L1-like esterase
MLKAELADDGLHPNAAGYALMVPLANAAIETALKK